jgi:preprotein translocase subunit SecE
MSKIISYFKETRSEMRYVNWPTKKQTVLFTALVVLISLATAAYLGIFDFVFSWLLKLII